MTNGPRHSSRIKTKQKISLVLFWDRYDKGEKKKKKKGEQASKIVEDFI